jgi:hypothetical protein
MSAGSPDWYQIGDNPSTSKDWIPKRLIFLLITSYVIGFGSIYIPFLYSSLLCPR